MNVQALAATMNVTENDVISLVNMTITELKADKMVEILLNSTEARRAEITMAYMSASVTKFQNFCVTLLTNEEKKNAFSLYVLSLVK